MSFPTIVTCRCCKAGGGGIEEDVQSESIAQLWCIHIEDADARFGGTCRAEAARRDAHVVDFLSEVHDVVVKAGVTALKHLRVRERNV